MTRKIRVNLCVVPIFVLAVSGVAWAQDDRTLSPFFFVQSDDTSIDQLPLESVEVSVSIAGVIANVEVKQVYTNEGLRPIEAIYVFPGSTRAAVHGMRMTVGNRLLEARIAERQQAREDYEQAVSEGRTASLLELQRPNVFQMNVGNILPGDVIEVELNYVELLVPEDGIYEFVFPTVVGPRYSETTAGDATNWDTWLETPYQHEGEESLYDYDINVQLNAGMPIADVSSPSHDVEITQPDEAGVRIALSNRENAGTKDYILRYNLRGNEVESGVLLYAGEEEKFFLVMMEPPARITDSEIPPREYFFVLDVSGSMAGFPLDTAKIFLLQLLNRLNLADAFNVITFSGGSELLFESSVPAIPENIQIAADRITRLHGGGGTRLYSALEHVYSLPVRDEGGARSIVTITDGYVGAEAAVFDLIRDNLDHSNFFSAGIGSSINRFLIEGMAYSGMGEPLVVTQPAEAERNVDRFVSYIQNPVLTQIQVTFEGIDAYDIEPPTIPDLFAQRPIIVFGKYQGEASGRIHVSGMTPAGPYERTFELNPDMENNPNEALRYLWARHRIRTLADYIGLLPSPELIALVTSLGLEYNLLTAYTSFIIIDTIIRNEDGSPVTVTQPLPMPQGVPDSAVPVENWRLYTPTDLDSAAPHRSEAPQTCLVLKVLDANTVRVSHKGRIETVRILGLDTLAPDESGYREAVTALRTRLEGCEVILRFETPDIEKRDEDGHLLAHLFIGQRDVCDILNR